MPLPASPALAIVMIFGRTLKFVLIPTLVLIFAQNQAISATSRVEFELKGVLISSSSRSALVNGEVARAGERVGGIEILAIEEDAIRVMSGSEEYAVPVGSSAWLLPTAARPVQTARLVPEPLPSVRRVNSGDTLSGIAEDYAGNGVSLSQVMIALFEANPQAFDGNINRLHAGADLLIPEVGEISRYTQESAVAEILRQAETWQAERTEPVRTAQSPAPVKPDLPALDDALESIEYGPVRFGETLSEIAVEVSGNDVSMSLMMAALFEANPHAFGDSIDLLHEGAVLRIPSIDEINPTATFAARVD